MIEIISGIVDERHATLQAANSIHPVVALEEQALRRWLTGDPDGFLEISADTVTYFDPFTEERLDGKQALADYYALIRGKIRASRYELRRPQIQVAGPTVVLTYNFASFGGSEEAMLWNCTEVFREARSSWEIIHTHWSMTKRS